MEESKSLRKDLNNHNRHDHLIAHKIQRLHRTVWKKPRRSSVFTGLTCRITINLCNNRLGLSLSGKDISGAFRLRLLKMK